MSETIMMTGGAGFIGANFVIDWINQEGTPVINLDRLTYVGNLNNFSATGIDRYHRFIHGDISNQQLVISLLKRYRPKAIIHFAAESHVDRSIAEPDAFIRTNVNGTLSLLEAARHYWQALGVKDQKYFRFLHISTDEVFGSLGPTDSPFTETSSYAPNSPYSASKAASDHLVRVYHHTYGLPTLTTNCSNNYGPRQFPEKLMPLVIQNALQGKELPIYGDGQNIRDWLYVEDHCNALRAVLQDECPGETYNIGGWNEKTNLGVVKTICAALDELHPQSCLVGHASLIRFAQDRPGHDRRYATDAQKIEQALGWKPKETFESGLLKTVSWYLSHQNWIKQIETGCYCCQTDIDCAEEARI